MTTLLQMYWRGYRSKWQSFNIWSSCNKKTSWLIFGLCAMWCN